MNGSVLSIPSVADPVDAPAAVDALRRFHFGTTSVDGAAERLTGGMSPALLAAALGADRVRGDFPLFVFAPGSDQGTTLSCSELLLQAVGRFAPEESQAKFAKDNLLRVERQIHNLVSERGGLVDADGVFLEAMRRVENELGLSNGNSERLASELAELREALPKGGSVLDLGDNTEWLLLLVTCRQQLGAGQAVFRAEVERLHGQLSDRLEIEHGKLPSARSPEAMNESVGATGTRFFDSGALAEVVGSHRGTVMMSEERRARIDQTMRALSAWLDAAAAPVLAVVRGAGLDAATSALTEFDDVTVVADEDACGGARKCFDAHAATLAKVCRAVRIAHLELADAYEATRHDAWFESFDWQAFSAEESQLLPCVVAEESETTLTGTRMLALSKLLRSKRPVRVMVSVDPARMKGEDDEATDFRFELAHFAVGHREAYVLQGLAARPEHLAAGFGEAVKSARPALIVTGRATGITNADGWLIGGAAVEGRAHPLFSYDPEQGVSWDGWYNGCGNPQPDQDWSEQAMTIESAAGDEESLDLAFTFADFALLDPAHAGHFTKVPADLDDDGLMPVADYLRLGESGESEEQIMAALPFIWAVDSDRKLQRLVISRRLAASCMDRLRFWRTIQELAGLRSHYAETAAEDARATERSLAEKNVEELAASHREEVESVRSTAAGEAMQGLAQLLLEVDLGAVPVASGSAPVATAPAVAAPAAAQVDVAAEPAAAEPAEAAEADEDEGFDDPWVDTPLCTSCNDCVALNKLMFVYDDNKQVLIGDPKSGSFAQLVEAAEKCPADCIHPGKPLDSSEPNLEDLIQRAAPYA